jgi:hypothetical protein
MGAKGWSTLKVVAVVLAIGGTACGGGSSNTTGVVSCTLTENVGGLGVLQICEELPAADRSQTQQGCTLPSGSLPADAGISAQAHFADAPCSHVNALGGCRVTNAGVTETIWYYGADVGDADVPGQTSSDIQSLCGTIGATFVAP